MFTGRALREYNNRMPYQEPHIYLSQQQFSRVNLRSMLEFVAMQWLRLYLRNICTFYM